MSHFVTLSKTDKEFLPTLTGRFSRTHFAQPVRNLYVSSANETITFKIIERSSMSLFGALANWYSLARNIYLIFPILGGLAYLTAMHGVPRWDLVLSSFCSLQFFLMSLTLYNDYSDYVSGVDRVNQYSQQKPLMQGWIRPFQAKQLAMVFLSLSVVFGLYCFAIRPYAFFFAVAALVASFLLTMTSLSRKLKAMTLIVSFLLAGPLLVLGYEFLLWGEISVSSSILGLVFGLHALKYDFCKQVRDIFYNSKAKVATLTTFFGFERSKILYSFLSVLHVGSLIAFAVLSQQKQFLLLGVVSICFEVYLNRLVHTAPSFLSSNISQCMGLQKLHYSIESSLIVFVSLSPLWLFSL